MAIHWLSGAGRVLSTNGNEALHRPCHENTKVRKRTFVEAHEGIHVALIIGATSGRHGRPPANSETDGKHNIIGTLVVFPSVSLFAARCADWSHA